MKTEDIIRMLDRLENVRHECNDGIVAVYRSELDGPLTREERRDLRDYLSQVRAITQITREEIELDGGKNLKYFFRR